MDDITDSQMEIGFIKLQLYDRMINTCSQAVKLFESMLSRSLTLSPEEVDAITLISNEVDEIFALEKHVQNRMDEELLKGSFGDKDQLN